MKRTGLRYYVLPGAPAIDTTPQAVMLRCHNFLPVNPAFLK